MTSTQGQTIKKIGLALAGLLIAALACGAPAPTPPPATMAPATPAATPPDKSRFAFGVEYAELGLGELYARTGVKWVKPRLESFAWGAIEVAPPHDGQHTYDWSLADATIAEYQKAGFEHIQLYVVSDSCWGDKRPLTACPEQPPKCPGQRPLVTREGIEDFLNKKLDLMPKDEYLDDWAAWVQALVERYDADGQADMPGLRYPLLDYVIGGEWIGFWPSRNAEDYVRLLRATYPAVKAANPQAQVGLIPLLLADVFEGDPPPDELARRLQNPPIFGPALIPGVRTLLDASDAFDYVDMHSLGDYTEIPSTVAWIRSEMAQRGYAKPIWIDDAFSMSPLIAYGAPILKNARPWYPVTQATRDRAFAILEAVADFKNPEHTIATAWLRGQAAASLVKRYVVAAGEEMVGVNVGNLEDWTVDTLVPLRIATSQMIGAAAFQGMADVSHPQGVQVCDRRVPGAPRPAWYTLKLVIAKLDGFSRVEKLPDLPEGVWGYRFTVRDHPVYALWYDHGVVAWPGEAPAAISVSLPATGSQVTLTHIVTEVGQTEPKVETSPVEDGQVKLALDTRPVFVEP